MKGRITYLLMIICAFALKAGAQDPHFTQITRIPSFYNPAAAGYGVEHIRLTMLYRNQWASVASPFTTQALFFDKAVGKTGLGLNLVNNSAGQAGMNQILFNGNLSQSVKIGKSYLRGGVRLGLIHKSFDPSKMTFDDQYVADQGFDPNTPTAETFSYTRLTRPDLGAGLHWSIALNDRIVPFAGFSADHLNQPKESFILLDNVHPSKYTMQGGADLRLSDQLTLSPVVLFSRQLMAQELMIGTLIKLPLQDRNAFEAGAYLRNKDAVALYTGYQWNSLMAGFSYDANISGVTGGPGAFELTLTYIPKAKEKKKEPVKPRDEKPEAKKNVPATKSPVVISTPPVPKPAPAPKPQEVNNQLPVPANAPVVKPQVAKPVPPPVKRENVIAVIPAPKLQTVKIKIPVQKHEPVRVPVTKMNFPDRKRDDIENVIPAPKLQTVKIKTPVQNYEPVSGPEMKVVLPEQKRDNVTAAIPAPKLHAVKIPLPVLKLSPVSRTLVKVTPPAQKRDTVTTVIPAPKPEPVIKPEPKPVTRAPEPDTDGDGIPDSKDKCIYIKGPASTNGCPDSDRDGIADSEDDCPMMSGTPENNGCPEIKVAVTEPLLTDSAESITFKTNSDEIKGIVRFEVIEPIVDFLYAHPEYRIVITGHTDSEGNELYNMKLSQKRADAIKAIFIRKGLQESRISTVAYGETMPLGNNRTEQGKAANRRAEIHIVK